MNESFNLFNIDNIVRSINHKNILQEKVKEAKLDACTLK